MDKAYSDFKGGVSGFQSLLQTVVDAAAAAQDELRSKEQALAAERVAFDEEKGRVVQVLLLFDSISSTVHAPLQYMRKLLRLLCP